MSQTRSTPELNVVVFQTGPIWAAQCLQVDIGAQGDNLNDVLYEMQRVIFGEFVIAKQNGVEPFEGLPPAPQEYWDKWQGSDVRLDFPRAPFPGTFTAPPLTTEVRVA